MFNLLTASFTVADVLGTGLVALVAPMLLSLPLWIYSEWMGANAVGRHT